MLIDLANSPHKGIVPILVGLLIAAIGLSFGYNCGYPINPARDLGPRIFVSPERDGMLHPLLEIDS